MDLSRTIGGLAVMKMSFIDSKEALEILDSAISHLKRQEPVEADFEGGGSSWWYVCGDCHGAIDSRDHYCKHCGREIIWK